MREGPVRVPVRPAEEEGPDLSLTGIVLAGGGSTRFGSDKLRASYRGLPLLHGAIAGLRQVCEDVVVVVAPDDEATDLPRGVRVVRDDQAGEGPLAGLHAGLMAAVRSDRAVVIGGDMPEAQAAVIRAMLEEVERAEVDAVVLEDGGEPRPLPMVLRTWSAAEAAHFLLHAGRRRLRDITDVLRTSVIPEPTWTALDPLRRSLVDVDVPEDLSDGSS